MDYPATQIDSMGPAGDELSIRADSIMPAQFYPARPGSASIEPVMRLMAGILIDAVRCFQRNFEARQRERRREFRKAQSWIFDDKEDGPFSFRWVCDSLEIDPFGLRKGIVRWQQKRRAGDKQRIIRRSPVNVAGRMQSRRRRVDRAAIEAIARE